MTFSPPFSLEKPWIHERAKISPDNPAIIYDNETISFHQLYERSLSRAQQLRVFGVEPGDIVALLLNNGLSAVEMFYAAQLCGATLLPLNTRLTAKEISFQLDETEPKVLIAEGEKFLLLARTACNTSNNLACLPILLTDLKSEQPSGFSADPQIPWTILYTSGTTGTPKGVVLTARHFGASAMASLSHLGAKTKDRWLCCMPLFHIAGLSILTRSVLTGACVVIHNRFEAEKVSQAIDKQMITLMSLVPTMLHRLVKVRLTENNKMAISMRAVLIGGASCSETLWQQALELGLPILRTYGLTEACSMIATEPLGDRGNYSACTAAVLPGVEVKIDNLKGQPVNASEEGEILVRGRMVMDHYYKRVEESAEALQGGWLHTGDIGFLDNQGRLCVLSRRSDLIVSGGENIYPAEVEASLLLHPAIEEVCVTGEDDTEFGQRVVAWVVKKERGNLSEEELQLHCRKALAGYKIPRKIIFIEQLPRNASGKIMRLDLVE